jgi:hypothetical protein
MFPAFLPLLIPSMGSAGISNGSPDRRTGSLTVGADQIGATFFELPAAGMLGTRVAELFP